MKMVIFYLFNIYKKFSVKFSPGKLSVLDKVVLFVLAQSALPFVDDGPKRMLWLRYLQHLGITMIPERYFESIPKVEDVDKRTLQPVRVAPAFPETSETKELQALFQDQKRVMDFQRVFEPIKGNHMFGLMDAMVYDYFIRKFNPLRIVEIGSGYSTFIALNATERMPAAITAIEPYPSDFLVDLVKKQGPARLRLIDSRVQDINDYSIYDLRSGDILFIDSSHVCNIGGDLPEIFGNVLPLLAKGVVVHVHDVSWPYEYPRTQAFKSGRFYNELYLLTTLINHGCYSYMFGSYDFLINRNAWLNKSNCLPFSSGSSVWLRKN